MNASASRFQREIARRTQQSLSLGGKFHQAEAIARHYASCAVLALQLHQITARNHNPSEATELAADTLMEKIKALHLQDFGLELEWPPQGD